MGEWASKFQFSVNYKPGIQNNVADSLQNQAKIFKNMGKSVQ